MNVCFGEILGKFLGFVTENCLSNWDFSYCGHYWVNLFEYEDSALELKTRIINQTKEILMDKGFPLLADIHELKIYKEEYPIPLRIQSELHS